MDELQHLLNKVNKVTAYHRHGNKIPLSALDDLSNAQIEYEKAIQVEAKVMQKPKPKTLQAIFEIVDNIDFELAQLEDIAKGEIGDKITLLIKYIDENRVSA